MRWAWCKTAISITVWICIWTWIHTNIFKSKCWATTHTILPHHICIRRTRVYTSFKIMIETRWAIAQAVATNSICSCGARFITLTRNNVCTRNWTVWHTFAAIPEQTLSTIAATKLCTAHSQHRKWKKSNQHSMIHVHYNLCIMASNPYQFL